MPVKGKQGFQTFFKEFCQHGEKFCHYKTTILLEVVGIAFFLTSCKTVLVADAILPKNV